MLIALALLDGNGQDRVIAFISKKLSAAEQNNTTYDRGRLPLIQFVESFHCSLEGSQFKGITESTVPKQFLDTKIMGRREARVIEMDIFGNFLITLKPAQTHVIGDAVFRIPNEGTVVNDRDTVH